MAEQLFIMEGNGQVRIYNGNYSSYRIELEESKQAIKNLLPLLLYKLKHLKKVS
jgi:ATP-binding cassette subfamily F protein uup